MIAKLEVDQLIVQAGEQRLVGPLSFTLAAGETVTLMGETGAGKSLLALAILGALPPGLTATGAVVLAGRRIDNLPHRERTKLWGRALTMLPQEPWRALDPLMRARTQVAESHWLVANRQRRAAERAAATDLAALDLSQADHKRPGQLSGGMAQRVAFAAARAGGAPLLIADEPTKGLDANRIQGVVDLLRQAVADGGALLAITHEIEVARRLGGTLVLLKEGAVVEQGATEALLQAPTSSYGKALLAACPSTWQLPTPPVVNQVVLQAESLTVARGKHSLVEGFELQLHAGERMAVTGPSGSGKSSLLDTLAGLLPPPAGRVIRGATLSHTAIQKLYQDPPASFPPRVALERSLRDVAERHGVPWGRALELLQRLGIAPALLQRRPDTVSGGELQRIALVRVLLVEPAVLLADEPTSRLDPITQAQVMVLIAEVAADQQMAVVLVTHNEIIAERWAKKRVLLPIT